MPVIYSFHLASATATVIAAAVRGRGALGSGMVVVDWCVARVCTAAAAVTADAIREGGASGGAVLHCHVVLVGWCVGLLVRGCGQCGSGRKRHSVGQERGIPRVAQAVCTHIHISSRTSSCVCVSAPPPLFLFLSVCVCVHVNRCVCTYTHVAYLRVCE